MKLRGKNIANSKNNNKTKNQLLVIVIILFPHVIYASELSANSYSGKGLIPGATSIPVGEALISFDPSIPGAVNTKGYNTQIGLGLYDGLELVGRLATNDQRCNMFVNGECPSNTIRDFSASIKWSIPNDWLKKNSANFAFGITDMGGAASYFKSYYAVASKEIGLFELSIGQAKPIANYALLKGTFGGVTYRPARWLDVNVQKVGSSSWATASLQSDLPYSQASGYITLNQRLTSAPVTEKKWVGVGVTMSLDGTASNKKNTNQNAPYQTNSNFSIANLKPGDLNGLLKKNGFYNPLISENIKLIKVEIENTSYVWNTLDAVGVALGALATSHGNLDGQYFELKLTTRGITQAVVTGEVPCLKRWLEKGEVCDSLSIRSGLQRDRANEGLGDVNLSRLLALDNLTFRPDFIISPIVISSIGTEFGSFDMDGGVNINVVLPLWLGAIFETNQIKPLGISTRGFEQEGIFYANRLKPSMSRKLLHQLVNVPFINTQARLSVGTAYTTWDGNQLETSTQTDNGRHRVGLTSGSFKNNFLVVNNQKKYELATYRYAHDDRLSTVTEITSGKFWGGDKGWSIGQKFWHGDTSLNIYLRKTRMPNSIPVAFAGLQLSIPITPRVNKGMQHMGLRGTSQWTYALESRIFEKENLLTGGLGEVPRIGEGLMQTFNRDRNSTRYLESNFMRARFAFSELKDE